MKVDIQRLENLSNLFFKVMGEIFLKAPSSETFNELPGIQIRILHQLNWGGPQKMKDIAGYVSVSMPSATAVIDKMVRAGLVERREDPRDRRVTLVQLSEDGQKTVRQLNRVHEQRLEELLGNLSPQKQVELIGAFERIHMLLEEIHGGSDSNRDDRTGRDPSDGHGNRGPQELH